MAVQALLGVLVASLAAAEPADGARAAGAVHPEYRWRVDAPLLGAGAACVLAGLGMDTHRRVVPGAGLDPGGIRLSIDRDIIGNRSTEASRASDLLLDGAIVYPIALMIVSASPGTHVGGTLRRSLLYVESMGLATGITAVAKSATSRPRPFTYLPVSERPAHGDYAVETDRAFHSMPSGHAATAWCAASFALTDHLISRPRAGWKECAAVGFAGGFLASAVSSLRERAGQHFPTDTLVGGAIGTASGVGVPLLHHYVGGGERAPLPPARAWWQAVAGGVAGIGAGLLVARAY